MSDFNKDWSFTLADEPYGQLLQVDESNFRAVELPHDYSIEQGYSKELGDGCTGFALGGLGWYRKKFMTTDEMKDKKVFVCFDGIYNRSNIYFNEELVAFHPFGYSPCMIDITEFMNKEENILAVRVDHTRYADSRWYTGSGIYRKVSLHILPKTYIPVWGTKVTTELDSAKEAKVFVEVELQNELEAKTVAVKTAFFAPSGEKVGEVEQTVDLVKEAHIKQEIIIENPVLWGIFKGNQYSAVTTLVVDGEVIQTKEDKFGVRYFHFDTNKGFFLNGKNELIKGVCLHHDAGLVGSAVPLDVWRRRLEALMECGCNAVRTAHNPVSADFLTLCDDLGLLVQEEFYDEWDNPKDKRYNMKEKRVDYITRGHHEFFKDYAKSDLQAVMKRDMNHPCIFQWSIGNEIEWTYPKYTIATGYFGANANGNYFWDEPPFSVEEIRANVKGLAQDVYEVGRTAQNLAAWTRELDTTRPVIANCILPSASYESGYTDALDMVGFSYRQVVYDRCHKHYPDKPIMGTENVPQWQEWKHVLEKEYISGIFLWTGIDYMGEVGTTDGSTFPLKALRSGLLDTAGFKKPSFYMFKALWQDTPSVYITTQTLADSIYDLQEDGSLKDKPGKEWQTRLWIWHDVKESWNYTAEEATVVEVYSNCESVTLYLNDEAISTKYLVDFEDHIYKWQIPYAAGKLTAVGTKDGATTTYSIHTVTEVANAVLTGDKSEMTCSSDEVVHVEADLVDAAGNFVKCAESEVTFIIEGDARLYGTDNGDPSYVGDHKALSLTTNNGKALLIIGGVAPGVIKVSAEVAGQKTNLIEVTII
ncbi:MAG: glycoside hydrolase family 2 TIM barrel-domain containing protein [Lachnospiraceae bacterium]